LKYLMTSAGSASAAAAMSRIVTSSYRRAENSSPAAARMRRRVSWPLARLRSTFFIPFVPFIPWPLVLPKTTNKPMSTIAASGPASSASPATARDTARTYSHRARKRSPKCPTRALYTTLVKSVTTKLRNAAYSTTSPSRSSAPRR
jgi:hypothetical protein